MDIQVLEIKVQMQFPSGKKPKKIGRVIFNADEIIFVIIT